MVFSLGGAIATYWYLTNRADKPAILGILAGFIVLLVVSFIHRVFIQWIFQCTLGKACTALRMVRLKDAARPTLAELYRDWFKSTWIWIASLLDAASSSSTAPENDNYLTTVRRRDLRSLRHTNG